VILASPAVFFCEKCEALAVIPVDPGVLVCLTCAHRRPMQFHA